MVYQVGDKILLNGTEYKITQELMGVYWGRKKYAKQDEQLDLLNATLIESSRKPKKVKEPPKIKLTPQERGQILRGLVKPETLRDNFQREIMILARLIRKFPHKEFWLEGFKPALKASSLLYWEKRPEVEDLYKKWALDLTAKVEPIKLENEKIGADIVLDTKQKRPKNLLELLK